MHPDTCRQAVQAEKLLKTKLSLLIGDFIASVNYSYYQHWLELEYLHKICRISPLRFQFEQTDLRCDMADIYN